MLPRTTQILAALRRSGPGRVGNTSYDYFVLKALRQILVVGFGCSCVVVTSKYLAILRMMIFVFQRLSRS